MASKRRLILTPAATAVLNKIAEKSGMDCWFSIVARTEKDGTKSDWVYDLENKRYVTLKYGIGQLHEGMTSYAEYGMTEKEIKVFEKLLEQLGIAEFRKLRELPLTLRK